MASTLGIGTSALLAIQQSIATTSNNIANVGTEGYNRQEAILVNRPGQFTSAGTIGRGVDVVTIERAYNEFLGSQVRDYTSSQSQYETFSGLTLQVNNSLASTQNNVSASLENFFSTLQDVAGSPSTLPERQVLLGDAAQLVDQQQRLNNQLQDLNRGVNTNLTNVVDEINSLSDNIARLNGEIVNAGSLGQPPNNLLDQRDQLLNQLSEKVNVSISEQNNGAVNVFVGNGQSLVVGPTVTELTVVANEFDAGRLEIGIASAPGNQSISNLLSGGELQGLLDFRDKVLEPAQAQLGVSSPGSNRQL